MTSDETPVKKVVNCLAQCVDFSEQLFFLSFGVCALRNVQQLVRL